MSAVVQIKKSPLEDFVAQVLPADRLDDLAKSLPAHIKPAMFQRNLLNAVMINPWLMDYSPGLVFREVSKAAALGLYLDPHLGEAYLVESYNYKTKSKEPQLRVGYQGLVKIARQSGAVKHIYAHEVHQNDRIEALLGAHKQLIHEPKLFTDRGPIIGYYAVAQFADGDFDFEPMDLAQIHGIRDRSDGWKAFKENKIKSTPWASDEPEMAKKTVIRRLTKRLPKSPELASAIGIEDEAEHSEFHARPRIVPPTPPKLPAPPAEQIETKAAPTPPRPPKPPAPELQNRAPAAASTPLDRYKAALAAATGSDDVEQAWNDIVEPAMQSNAIDRDTYESMKALENEAMQRFEP